MTSSIQANSSPPSFTDSIFFLRSSQARMAAATFPSLPMLPNVPVAFGLDTLLVGLILKTLDYSRLKAYLVVYKHIEVRDESLDRIHRHSQLLGDHLSHLGVHPLTHLDPAMGDGHTAVIVVDGNVDRVPEAE